MEEQKNVRWILIISLIMFFVSIWMPTLFGGYYIIIGPRGEPSLWDRLWLYIIPRVGTLLFITTLAIATLFTSGYAKARTYILTIYLFIVSMGLFFISFLRGLFILP